MFGRKPANVDDNGVALKKVGILEFYDKLKFATAAQNDSKAGKVALTQNDEFGVDFRGSYCGERVVYYYMIDKYPRTLPIDWKERLRYLCVGSVRLTFLNYIRGHKIEWDSSQMHSKLRIMEQIGRDKADTEVTAYNLHENLGGMQSQEWIESSLTYLAEADLSRGRGLLKSSLLLCVAGERGSDFDKSIKSITDSARRMGLRIQRVLCNVPDTM